MELKGAKFLRIYDERMGEGKNGPWRAVSFAVKFNDRIFAFDTLDGIDDLKKAKEGDLVTVDFKIDCREYNGKYYTSLKVNTLSVEYLDKPTKEDDGLPF